MKAVFCLSLLTVGLVGCSGSDKNEYRDNVTYDYDTQSCTYQTYSGGPAVAEKLSKIEMSKAAFGKPFNYSLFEGVASASIDESMKFISRTNVKIYKTAGIRTNQCERNLFESAAVMPSDIQKKWNQSYDEGTMAIYLPKGEPGVSSNKNQGAIVIRENTNRWTLVHEFMHHLFKLKAAEDGVDAHAARANYLSEIDKLGNVYESSMPEQEKIKILAEGLPKAFKSFDITMTQFSLEEIAIEDFLKTQKRKGILQYAPESTNWYIHFSAKKVIEGYEGQKNLAKTIRTQAIVYSLTAEVSALDNMISYIDARLSDVERVKAANPYFGEIKLSADLGLTSLGHSENHEAPCGRDHEMDEVFDALNKFN